MIGGGATAPPLCGFWWDLGPGPPLMDFGVSVVGVMMVYINP
jgi:hypothetical protein